MVHSLLLSYAIVYIITYLSIVPFAYSAQKNDADLQAINDQLHEAKYLLQNAKNDFEEAGLWGNIGMMLQVKDVIFHEGGGKLQPEALECFNKALSLAAGKSKNLVITVNHRKGLLLKMMGKGEDAVVSHDLAYAASTTLFDKSLSLASKADAYTMLGDIKLSIDLYREALSLRPDRLEHYLPLVKCLREQNELNKDSWKALLKEMKSALKKRKSGKFDFAEDTSTADLLFNDDGSLGSEIYWAMFEVNVRMYVYTICLQFTFLGSREGRQL